MEEENEVLLDSENQDVDGTNDENDVSETGSNEAKKAFEDQKKRAEKAEAELKALKARLSQTPKEVAKQPEEQTLSTLSREEAILIAEGMKEDDLGQLQAIAKGKGISLLKAKEDPLFVSYYEKVEKERRSEKAKLGASKGSATRQEAPAFTNGLSTEDHRKLWSDIVKK